MAYKRVVPLNSRVYNVVGSFQIREDMESGLSLEQLRNKYDDLFQTFVNNRYCDTYYFIIHHYKEDEDNIWHVHYIMHRPNQVVLTTVINRISQYFKVDSRIVNADKLVDLSGMLLYFLHQDKKSIEEGKTRYEIDELISNMPFDEVYNLTYDNEIKDSEVFSYLEETLISCRSLVEVGKLLGYRKFHKYKYEINIIWQEINESRYKKKEYQDTPF